MPWTIWPALLVLWGVCWMFYDNFNWSWEEENFLSTIDDTIGLFESDDHIDHSAVFNHNLDDFTFHTDTSMSIGSHLNVPSLELPQQPLVCKPDATSERISTPNPSTLPLAVEAGEVSDPPAINLSTPDGRPPTLGATFYGATSTSQQIAENEPSELAETDCPLLLNTSQFHTHTRNKQVMSPRSSKHGQIEKYYCTYSDCDRSHLGRGFKRKDNLDQHLRGVHKQMSIPRMRAKPTASVLGNQFNQNEGGQPIIQFKKRSHGSNTDNGQRRGDDVLEELAEERRLRLLTDQENQRLRQKIENYEERMQKYEERLDRMMIIIERHHRKQDEET